MFCWSDSEIALYWIKGTTKQWKPWVNNRVNLIRKSSISVDKWRHVPGTLNPADIPTRKISLANPDKRSLWFNGPEFLLQTEKFWPKTSINENIVNNEVIQEFKCDIETTSNLAVSSQVETLHDVIDIERYSSLKKLFIVTAYVIRFTNNLIYKIKKKDIISGDLSLDELNYVEYAWIKSEQSIIKSEQKFLLLKKSLNLFENNKNLYRVSGRFGNSDMNYSENLVSDFIAS